MVADMIRRQLMEMNLIMQLLAHIQSNDFCIIAKLDSKCLCARVNKVDQKQS